MVQIREATAKLRMLLAEIRGREEQMDAMVRQFSTQLARMPRQAAYGRASLDAALNSMNEIQERLDYAKATREHLLAIKQQITAELEALQITQQVEAAKESLGQLKAKQASQGALDEAEQQEVRKLEGFIAEYSKVAERAITASLEDR